jgi:hypothetical protein
MQVKVLCGANHHHELLTFGGYNFGNDLLLFKKKKTALNGCSSVVSLHRLHIHSRGFGRIHGGRSSLHACRSSLYKRQQRSHSRRRRRENCSVEEAPHVRRRRTSGAKLPLPASCSSAAASPPHPSPFRARFFPDLPSDSKPSHVPGTSCGWRSHLARCRSSS